MGERAQRGAREPRVIHRSRVIVTGSSLPLCTRTWAWRNATSERSWISDASTPEGRLVADGPGRGASAQPASTPATTSVTAAEETSVPAHRYRRTVSRATVKSSSATGSICTPIP